MLPLTGVLLPELPLLPLIPELFDPLDLLPELDPEPDPEPDPDPEVEAVPDDDDWEPAVSDPEVDPLAAPPELVPEVEDAGDPLVPPFVLVPLPSWPT
jgi:hypothetical protein